MIYTSPGEVFWIKLQISVVVGVYATMPLFWVQIWAFIAPGLTKRGQYNIFITGVLCIFLLYFSSFMTLYLILPNALTFLFSVVESSHAKDLINLNFIALLFPYLKFSLSLLFAIAVLNQAPLLILFFSQQFSLTPIHWVKWRPHIWLLSCFFATILSPPDIFSQISLSIILISSFEIYLWLFFIIISYSDISNLFLHFLYIYILLQS